MGGSRYHRGLVRQWKLVRALSVARLGLTFAELREAAGEPVSVRTIYRDVDTLTFAGFPIDVVSDYSNGTKVHLKEWRVN